jgi:hypothetical protein
MRRWQVLLFASLVLCCSKSTADPLAGNWVLNVSRSHYGPGAEPRRDETFACEPTPDGVKCSIASNRVNGRRLVGTFEATYDQAPCKVSGMLPEIDEVSLAKIDEHVADATFRLKGEPVFAYRAVRSDDGHSLTVISVEPRTRVALSSVIVYDAQ